jgi:hypothetical protein
MNKKYYLLIITFNLISALLIACSSSQKVTMDESPVLGSSRNLTSFNQDTNEVIDLYERFVKSETQEGTSLARAINVGTVYFSQKSTLDDKFNEVVQTYKSSTSDKSNARALSARGAVMAQISPSDFSGLEKAVYGFMTQEASFGNKGGTNAPVAYTYCSKRKGPDFVSCIPGCRVISGNSIHIQGREFRRYFRSSDHEPAFGAAMYGVACGAARSALDLHNQYAGFTGYVYADGILASIGSLTSQSKDTVKQTYRDVAGGDAISKALNTYSVMVGNQSLETVKSIYDNITGHGIRTSAARAALVQAVVFKNNPTKMFPVATEYGE